MRRFAALLAASALASAACSSDNDVVEVAQPASTQSAATTEAAATSVATTEAPTTTAVPVTTTPAPEPTVPAGEPCPQASGLPPLLISEGKRISILRDGVLTRLADLPSQAGVALSDGAGGAIVQRLEPIEEGQFGAVELIHLDSEGRATLFAAPRDIVLYDTGAIAGGFMALYGVYPNEALESGPLVLHPLDGGQGEPLGDAFGPEFGIQSAKIAASTILGSAGTDLTEAVFYLDERGTTIEARFSPTDTLEYNMPPYISNAAPSPDGSTMVWLEGPDWDGVVGDFVPGPTRLVLAESATGAEITRVDIPQLSDNGLPVSYLDYDGRYAIVSFEMPGDDPRPVVAVDLSTEPPTATELCVNGIATLAEIYTG